MNPQIMDALVQTINEAINSKVKSLKDDLIGSIANEQRRHLIQLSKTAVKSEIMDLGTSLRTVIEEQIKNIPEPKDGKDGQSVTSEQIAEAVTAWMVDNFVHPKDGTDGTSVTVEDVKELAEGWLSQNIKQPSDGRDGLDGKSVSIEEVKALSEEWLSKNIQQPTNGRDGIDGQDGKGVSIDEVKALSEEWLSKNIQQPANGSDGVDGKDGKSVSIDEVKSMSEEWLSQNIQQPKDGRDGVDGTHGKDAADIDVLPSIDETKSYPKGTWASYRGGLIKSVRDTYPIGEKSLIESGWDIVVQGIQAIEVHTLNDGEFAIKSVLTSGQDHITKMTVPTMIYKGVWKESHGMYNKGHTVTQSGSLWVCLKATDTKPGSSDDWQLAVKKGVDGKDLSLVKLNRPETYKMGNK
jgi:hypothetical protein